METMPYSKGLTVIADKGKLDIRGGVVLPDSIAFTTKRAMFDGENKGNLFIIKLDIARKYTWGEICRGGLYDRLPVTWKEFQENDYLIDYNPQREEMP